MEGTGGCPVPFIWYNEWKEIIQKEETVYEVEKNNNVSVYVIVTSGRSMRKR